MKLDTNKKALKLVALIILMIIVTSCNPDSNTTETEPMEEQPELYNIDTAVVWTSKHNPYLLKEDIKIFNGGSLTILEGVEIFLFEEIIVYSPAGNTLRHPIFDVRDGTINCLGSENNTIRMLDSAGIDVVGYIKFDSSIQPNLESVIEGVEAKLVYYWDSRKVYIKNSIIDDIHLQGKSYKEIISNKIEILSSSYGGDGIIQGNRFDRGVSLQFDSSLVKDNVFESTYSHLRCALDSKTRVIGNTFSNGKLAIIIHRATPIIQGNNIYNNEVNILIKPVVGSPQSDTVYAINNWWGTTDSSEIADKIIYEEYMNTVSEKHIQFIPFSNEPIDLL